MKRLEGKIVISLTLAGGQVKGVEIASRPLVDLGPLLQGKSVEEAAQTVPLLFSLCGTAQACAAVEGCEGASGMVAAPLTAARRHALVAMETLREHLWRMLLEWPVLTDGPPLQGAMGEVMKIASDYGEAVTPQRDLFLPGADAGEVNEEAVALLQRRLQQVVERDLFGCPPDRWLALATVAELERWAESGAQSGAHNGTGVAAGMTRWLLKMGWGGVGACEIAPLPELNAPQLEQAMRRDDFIARPQWEGECCETTSLARSETPLLAAVRHRFGNGLLARVVARLSEVALLLKRLHPIEGVEAGKGRGETGVPHVGIGQVAAARGQLVHRVALVEGRVDSYRILAPTEWNFHPQGVVARTLATLAGDKVEIAQQTQLLVNAIDPCVGYALRFEGESAAHA